MSGDDAQPVGAEFLANTQTTNPQVDPDVTVLSADSFVVTWRDASGLGGDATGSAIKGQVFSTAGGAAAPVGSEFLVNTQTLGGQDTPSVTALSASSFVVTWRDPSGLGGDASGFGIKGQVFSVAGATPTRDGPEFLVNTETLFDQDTPSVTALSADSFVVTWSDASGLGGDASGFGIKGQVFSTADGAAAPLGSEFLVNTQTASSQYQSSVTALSADSFVVAWTDDSTAAGDPSSSAVRGQVFSVTGGAPEPVGSEFLVNTQTVGSQDTPSITALSADSFVVTWRDAAGDASDSGVKGQMFSIVDDAVVEQPSEPPKPYNPDDPDNRALGDGNDTFSAHGGDDIVSGWVGNDALQGTSGTTPSTAGPARTPCGAAGTTTCSGETKAPTGSSATWGTTSSTAARAPTASSSTPAGLRTGSATSASTRATASSSLPGPPTPWLTTRARC